MRARYVQADAPGDWSKFCAWVANNWLRVAETSATRPGIGVTLGAATTDFIPRPDSGERAQLWLIGSTVHVMIGFVILLLVIWLVLALLGVVIKGLFWLAIIGIVLFVVTVIVGYIKRGGSRSKG
jgi:hypothetical protein